MNEGGMLKPALIAGVLLGILSALPFLNALNCFCCAWVLGGGILAAHFYVKASPVAISMGRGVGLGALTGAIGSVTETIFRIPLDALMRKFTTPFLNQIRDQITNLPNMPGETKDLIARLISDSGGVSILLIIIGGIFRLFMYSIIAMLGGAIGVALFEKRKPGSPMSGGYPSGGSSPSAYIPPDAPPPPVPPADFPES